MRCVLPDACSSAAARERLAAFVRNAGIDPGAICDIYEFGSEPEQVDELAALVASGTKRATTSLLRWYDTGGERLPVVGDIVLVLASGCAPCAIVEVTRVEIVPFCDVDAAFAWDEGEGDRSLRYWQDAHRSFFMAEAERSGFIFSESDAVVLCRFTLVDRR